MYLLSIFLLIPISFVLISFLIDLFYRCGTALLVLKIILSVLISWLIVRKINLRLVNNFHITIAMFLLMLTFFVFVYLVNAESSVNASLKTKLNNLTMQAEIYYYDNNSSYENICNSSEFVEIRDYVESFKIYNNCMGPVLKWFFSKEGSTLTFSCKSTPNNYIINAKLIPLEENSIFKKRNEVYWCVDSSGKTSYINTIPDSLSCIDS
ncbi:MAG: hypothetical protein R3B60_00570 [Candidatus Paceibacterota bacterium]